MRFIHSIKTAINGLHTHRSRASLTILGIVIGITSIITIMSLGGGAKSLILTEIQGQVGSRVIEIRPGREPKGPTDFLSMFSDSLRQKDVEALKEKINVPNLLDVMPLVFGSASAAYGGETYQTTYYGMSDIATKLYAVTPDQGRFLSEEDVKGYTSVVVIGSKVRDELFTSGQEAIGQKIKIKGRNYKIIGILPAKGQGVFSFDDSIIIPYTTAQQYILGEKYYQHIIVEVDEEANVTKTVEDIKITIRNSHNITDPKKDDFSVSSAADAVKMINSVMNILTSLLIAIAAISLVVGGIGIMNIMLVSVTERTKEIGLRKAVGATNADILIQFLLEAIILTGIGGVIGIIFGGLLSYTISIIIISTLSIDWFFAFPWNAAISGFIVSGFIGLIFGIYPANQASKKSPIEALRYE